MAVLVALLLMPWRASAQGGPNPSKWEADIRAFEAADLSDPPVRGGIIFTGSSSIRLWTTLKEDFPGLPVVNRGFGGSMLPEVTAFVDRIITPHQPMLVVVYCGGNDINAGRSADQVFRDFQALGEGDPRAAAYDAHRLHLDRAEPGALGAGRDRQGREQRDSAVRQHRLDARFHRRLSRTCWGRTGCRSRTSSRTIGST